MTGQVTLCQLDGADVGALQRHLHREAIANLYLLSELQFAQPAGLWWGITDGNGLRAAVLVGSLTVPSVADPVDAAHLADVMANLPPPRMIFGPRESTIAFHQAISPSRPAREIRDYQPLMTLTARSSPALAATVPLRRARPGDVDSLTVAAARMHREEMGIDPLAVDAYGWRQRMAGLIDRGWSWVWMEQDEVIFKAELSAWTVDGVQIQGVYTAPAHRGRGVATAALTMLCKELFCHVPVCSLYLNDYNLPARRLYTRLGFITRARYATVMF